MKRTRAQFGDIVEIKTPKGLAYAQYTHRHPQQNALIRVFSGFHSQRPDDFSELVAAHEQFLAFVLLDAAVRAGLLAIVGHEEIPDNKRAFPVFRSQAGNAPPPGELRKNWWLWDGEKSWYVGELTEEQYYLPVDGILNPAAIVELLMIGWRTEDYR